jgi:hypothetical protein
MTETTRTETPEVPADPLEMARNALAHVRALVAFQVEVDTDPEKALLARVHHVGAQADQDSKVAARMATVSIAEDVRRIADHLTRGARPVADVNEPELNAAVRATDGAPGHFWQYAVKDPAGNTTAYGDQSWVMAGIPAGQVDGETVVRDIWVTGSPWRPAPARPTDTCPGGCPPPDPQETPF